MKQNIVLTSNCPGGLYIGGHKEKMNKFIMLVLSIGIGFSINCMEEPQAIGEENIKYAAFNEQFGFVKNQSKVSIPIIISEKTIQ